MPRIVTLTLNASEAEGAEAQTVPDLLGRGCNDGGFRHVLIESRGLAALFMAAGPLLFAPPCLGQSSRARTYCNPIDIAYKYNFEQLNEGISHLDEYVDRREGRTTVSE